MLHGTGWAVGWQWLPHPTEGPSPVEPFSPVAVGLSGFQESLPPVSYHV